MRWKEPVFSRPYTGDMRYTAKFLWWPRKFRGQWRWLEIATVRQQYHGLGRGWRDYDGWYD